MNKHEGQQGDLFGAKPPASYSLYDGNPPAQKHSATSRAAAAQIKQKIGPLHLQIIKFLTEHPRGATDEQMQAEIPMGANTQRPRRVELTQLGRVVDSGRRERGASRREAVVWVLV